MRRVEICLGEDGRKLAELFAIQQELKAALERGKRYVEKFTHDFDMHATLTFLIVKYIRCFNGGVRSKTSNELLNTMNPGEREIHDIAYALRDKHVAHSVSDWETNRIELLLYPEDSHSKNFTIVPVTDQILGPNRQFIAELNGLIDSLIERIQIMLNEEYDRVDRMIRKRLSMEQIYELKTPVPNLPANFENLLMGKGRKHR